MVSDETVSWETEMWGEKETLLRSSRVDSGKIVSRGVVSGKTGREETGNGQDENEEVRKG